MFLLKKFAWDEAIKMTGSLKKLRRNSRDKKQLHSLRVAVKKINAVIQFANFITGEPGKYTLPKKLLSVFKKAGNVRELQLHLNFMQSRRYTSPEMKDFTSFLKKSLRKKMKKLEAEVQKSKKKKTELALERVFYRVKNTDTGMLVYEYERWRNNIFPAYAGKNADANVVLHDLRKNIKNLVYIYDALHVDVNEQQSAERKQLDRLQDELGAWHDRYMLVKFLDEYGIKGTFRSNINYSALYLQKKIMQNLEKQNLVIKPGNKSASHIG